MIYGTGLDDVHHFSLSKQFLVLVLLGNRLRASGWR